MCLEKSSMFWLKQLILMRRYGLTHKLPKSFPHRKESVQGERYDFSLLKHPVIAVTGYKFMVLNLKCMSVYNVIEHPMLHIFFVVDIQKKMSLSQIKEKK